MLYKAHDSARFEYAMHFAYRTGRRGYRAEYECTDNRVEFGVCERKLTEVRIANGNPVSGGTGSAECRTQGRCIGDPIGHV